MVARVFWVIVRLFPYISYGVFYGCQNIVVVARVFWVIDWVFLEGGCQKIVMWLLGCCYAVVRVFWVIAGLFFLGGCLGSGWMLGNWFVTKGKSLCSLCGVLCDFQGVAFRWCR